LPSPLLKSLPGKPAANAGAMVIIKMTMIDKTVRTRAFENKFLLLL
jgi:hypothetical protein